MSEVLALIDYRQLTAFSLFAWVAFITPGPNNLWLLSSGASFGLMRTLPHMGGIFLGFIMTNIAVGMGALGMLANFPLAEHALKFFGFGYMMYMAWRMAQLKSFEKTDPKKKPMTFVQAALFQAVNPKALSVSVVALSSYALFPELWTDLWLKLVLMSLIGIPPLFIWTLFGVGLRRFLLEKPERFRLFKNTMVFLILISIALAFLPSES